MTLRLEDVRVDEYRRGDGRVMSMTLTHLPTGTVVHSDDVGDERSPLRLRDRLLEQLEAKVLERGS